MKYTLILLLSIITLLSSAQSIKVTPEDLDGWIFLGEGEKLVESHNMFFMKESAESKGVMIVSSESYGKEVVLKYEVMALTPATVLVALMSASNIGNDNYVSIPQKYDGSMKLWIDDVESYFYAFRNAPHNFTPFIRKYPVAEGENPALVSYANNIMHCGIFYKIEIGRKGNLVWLKINDKKILETTDPDALDSGQFALRIRGTAGEYAACLIRNMTITK